ncbi:unnamed protein product [Linum trigynum]|uniref:Uncharacterized protein n=1 Tax=Linum trigynum TaxID=586398 RepID=A0AAV2D2S8_9ROSI
MRLRINDRFGWSKYGVEPQIGSKWSVWDMSNGSVLYRDRVEDDDDDGSSSSSVGWEKLLEEKEKQVAALEAALEALIRDKRENKIKCDLNMV